MSKKEELPTIARHVQLYAEDWDWLEANYGPRSATAFGTARAVRKIVHKRVLELKAAARAKIDAGSQQS